MVAGQLSLDIPVCPAQSRICEGITAEKSWLHASVCNIAHFMPPRSLNLVVTVWWVILFLSVGMLFIFMLLTPEVAVFDSHSKQNEEIQNIRVETNLVFLQQRAVIDVQLAGATNSTAKGLCYLAQGAFLLIFGGSIAGLLQIRRLKKLLNKSDRTTNQH